MKTIHTFNECALSRKERKEGVLLARCFLRGRKTPHNPCWYEAALNSFKSQFEALLSGKSLKIILSTFVHYYDNFCIGSL